MKKSELKHAHWFVGGGLCSCGKTYEQILETEVSTLKAEIEAEQKRGDMHADINRRAAEALGKPFSGDGSSWHDIPECIAELKSKYDYVEGLNAAVVAENTQLKAERDVLRKLLQEREWVRNVYGYKYCPECTEAEKDGHAKDCPYGAALHATEAKDVCPSCTWRGDVTLVNGVCPYCDVNWHALRDAEVK